MTIQDIQLELIKKTSYNNFNGKKIYEDLIANKSLWKAVIVDRINNLIKLILKIMW